MYSKTLSTHLTSGKVEVKFTEDNGKRSVEIPALKLEDDVDAEHISEILSHAYGFLTGDTSLADWPF